MPVAVSYNTTPINEERRESLEDYILSGTRQISQLLHELHERRALITAHYGEQRSFLTAVLGLSDDGEGLLLDASPDAAVNREATEAARLICVTQLDQIRIQFTLRQLRSVAEHGRKLLHAPLPTDMLRLQRRATYRLLAPVSQPLSGELHLPAAASAPASVLSGRIIDLSIGGVALLLPANASSLVIGSQFDNSQLGLPSQALSGLSLRLRYLLPQPQRSGTPMLRCGFAFSSLSHKYETLIQRYIFQTERERKAREAGAL